MKIHVPVLEICWNPLFCQLLSSNCSGNYGKSDSGHLGLPRELGWQAQYYYQVIVRVIMGNLIVVTWGCQGSWDGRHSTGTSKLVSVRTSYCGQGRITL